ncbi:MAG: IS21 family transposase, partial [Acidobacteriota bacterium]
MAYKRIGAMDLYQLISRWHVGYNISEISKALGLDRKTVRQYIRLAEQAGVSRADPLPEKTRLLEQLEALLPAKKHIQPVRGIFGLYKDEIIRLVTANQDPLKPKTAYEVICERYGLTASYTSFKRFIREHAEEFGLSKTPQTTCRFETEPAEEVQIDYGKMGRLYDPLTRRNRDVYAFIATLSFSRLKFVDFVYKQDQRSFVGSHLRMFDFFGGVCLRLVIDNLKAGGFKPDLYLPQFNRAYQEMAEHYGCFIDPARPYHPKDKGKVERAVPVVRELFRKLKALHPALDVARANKEARKWCLETNGMSVHGSTGLRPFDLFQEIEKSRLGPLPIHPFEVPTWKAAKVHVDQFIQFEKKTYGVPQAFVGTYLWVRGTDKLVQIYDDHTLVKKYVRSAQSRQYDPNDFPKNLQLMLESRDVRALIERAESIGPAFKKLLLEVLTPHARLNYRRALGLLRLQQKYPRDLLDRAAEVASAHNIHTPRQFKALIDRTETKQQEIPIPISDETRQFVRDPDYFIH